MVTNKDLLLGVLLAIGCGTDVNAQTQAADSVETPIEPLAASAELAVIPVQSAAPEVTPPERARSASRVIEDVVFTAQKREENLQEFPISITAFSGDKLDALGVGDPGDLELVTPGLVYSTNPVNCSIVYIRGIGTDAFIPSVDSSVATYVDGPGVPTAPGEVHQRALCAAADLWPDVGLGVLATSPLPTIPVRSSQPIGKKS